MNQNMNPFAVSKSGAVTYQAIRPTYPSWVIDTLVAKAPKRLVDIGAGTGIFSRQIASALPGSEVIAVEPAATMREAWREVPKNVCLLDATSETTGLGSGSADVVTWAQSFHWVDREKSGVEALRILTENGVGVVVANQMDVSVPWVHRLTRIMRSGDVLSAARPPSLPGFVTSAPMVDSWSQKLLPEQVLALARTRSSYLRSDAPRQERMQNNLRWYLNDHLGYAESDVVEIPYQTFLWELRRVRDAN